MKACIWLYEECVRVCVRKRVSAKAIDREREREREGEGEKEGKRV